MSGVDYSTRTLNSSLVFKPSRFQEGYFREAEKRIGNQPSPGKT